MFYLSTAKTPAEFRDEVIRWVEQQALIAHRSATPARLSNIERAKHTARWEALRQVVDFLELTTFDRNEPTPRAKREQADTKAKE